MWIKNQVCASVEWLQMDRGVITDEEAIVSFQLFDKPYKSKYDMSKNSTFHINCLVETPSFRVERKQDHSFFC